MITVESKKDDEMILKFTNGDIAKFDEVMKKYNFVDAQALIRFAVSILLVTENKFVQIRKDGELMTVEPAEHSVKKEVSDGKCD